MQFHVRIVGFQTLPWARLFRGLLLGVFLANTSPRAEISQTDPGARPDAVAIAFENVSKRVGIDVRSMSWSLAFRDYDVDGFPDLWVSNHGGKPSLYHNEGDGTFRLTSSVIKNVLVRDGHGAAWADIDNDGDADILELAGARLGTGAGSNQLFVNQGDSLESVIDARGLQYPKGRGRMPLWTDFDRDGVLDVLLMNQARPGKGAPSALFSSLGGHYRQVPGNAGLKIPATKPNTFAILADVAGSPLPEVVVFGSRSPPRSPRVFEQRDTTFFEVTESIVPTHISDVYDAVAQDFNGDMKTDLFLPRWTYASKIAETGHGHYRVGILKSGKGLRGVDVHTTGDLHLLLHLPSILWHPRNVHVGKSGSIPEPLAKSRVSVEYRLSVSDPKNRGEPQIDELKPRAIYIWFDPEITQWRIRLAGRVWTFLPLEIASSQKIDEVEAYRFETDTALQPYLLLSRETGFDVLEGGTFLESGAFPSCLSAAGADFDNDMDVDLYLVCSEAISNIPNLVLENTGNGRFRKILLHGAEGTREGIGGAVALADYDNDGFVDAAVSNGHGPRSSFSAGPYEVFRNRGNKNHWLKIKLEGTASNRDAVGARVVVTAGGRNQKREMTGGVHYRAQDDNIVHFGLGDHSIVDSVEVVWPSGLRQRVQNIPVDQTIHVIERSERSAGRAINQFEATP